MKNRENNREQERTQAAYDYVNSDSVRVENHMLAFGDFIKGAEWSDEHPKEGMVNIDDVGNWLIRYHAQHVHDAYCYNAGKFDMYRCVYLMKKDFDAYMQAKRDKTKRVIDVKF